VHALRPNPAMRKDTGARYEIRVDSVTRTWRDDLTIALDTAEYLRTKPGNALVEVIDSVTGKPVTSDAPAQPSDADLPLMAAAAQKSEPCPHWPGCGCGTQSGPHACEWRDQDLGF
jgi:hypothetical protein